MEGTEGTEGTDGEGWRAALNRVVPCCVVLKVRATPPRSPAPAPAPPRPNRHPLHTHHLRFFPACVRLRTFRLLTSLPPFLPGPRGR